VAQVPNTAGYKAKELLHLANIQVNGGAIPTINDDGIHVVAYLGDANGDGMYTAADAQLTARVANSLDTGFAAYRLVDPVVLADSNGTGFVDNGDASIFLEVAAGNTIAQVAPIPNPAPSLVPTGPDPTLSLPADLHASPGNTVSVPVLIDDPAPAGSPGMVEAVLALQYDPNVLTVSSADIHLGTLPSSADGWSFLSIVNPASGQLAIDLSSATPITTHDGGSLVQIDFHVKAGAVLGMTSVQLVQAVNPIGGHLFTTEVSDALGAYVLNPAPNRGGSAVEISAHIDILADSSPSGVPDNPAAARLDAPAENASPGAIVEAVSEGGSATAAKIAPPLLDEVFAGLILPMSERASIFPGSIQPSDESPLSTEPSPLSLESSIGDNPDLEQMLATGIDWGIANVRDLNGAGDGPTVHLPLNAALGQSLAAVFSWDDYFALTSD
jgi:hypothetical protein